jgi:hypothetical protein
MAKRNRFPPEPDTEPELQRPKPGVRTSGAAPKSRRHNESTLPPPKSTRGGVPSKTTGKKTSKPDATRTSGVKSKRPRSGSTSGAVVDEVVADLSKDPRRDKDD